MARGALPLLLLAALAVACDDGGSGDAAPDAPPFDLSGVEFPHCAADEAAIEALYARMTTRQRVGQTLAVGMQRSGERLNDLGVTRMAEFHVGNVFVQPIVGIAMDAPATTARFIHDLQQTALEHNGVAAFVCLDQEGGMYAAVNELTGGTDSLTPLAIGATGDPQVAFDQFEMMGREIRALGFNLDLGPVLDTLHVTDHGNLNTRPFGPDAERNRAYAVAAMAGLQSVGILAVGKHFPGDGMTAENTHTVLVTNPADRTTLDAELLKPFRAAIDQGLDGIMTIPMRYSALDPERSAITSRAISTDLLKGELGFGGLVVSDDLHMKGVEHGLSPGMIPGLEALKAGAHLLLYVGFEQEAELAALVTGIEAALETGELDPEEFAATVKHVLRMKQRYCLLERPTYPDAADIAAAPDRTRQPADDAMSLAHAERAVVLVDGAAALPVAGRSVLYVGPMSAFTDPASGWELITSMSFGDALRGEDRGVERVEYFLPLDVEATWTAVAERLPAADVVVAATLNAQFASDQQALLDRLLAEANTPVVHVSLSMPWDLNQSAGRAAARLALQCASGMSYRAAARVLYGRATAGGTLQVSLDD